MTRRLDTPPRTCEHCGQTYERRPNQDAHKFNRQRFCGPSCAARFGAIVASEHIAARRAQTLEDLEWIIGTDSPEHIARRLGYSSTETLERLLYRWGRPDLATRFQAVDAA